MVKQKTKKSVVKRFRITKHGKVLHRTPGGRHKRSQRSKSQIRAIKRPKKLFQTIAKKIRKILGY